MMPSGASGHDIELVAVRKSFGAFEAVRGVDLVIERGAFVTLLGPSGCGKTTLLRIIAGIEEPTSGVVRVAGRAVAATPLRERQTRMVFQSYALFPHMTVADNVAYGLRAIGVERSEIARRVGEALEMIGIPDKARSKPGDLSGGQQQRVALARALVTRPTVLLLDEPLGALDLKMRRRMQIELKSLQRGVGITFVYVTHDQEEALALSDRIVVMENGRIVQDDVPTKIYNNPASPYVADFIGETNLIDVMPVVGHAEVEIAGSRLQIAQTIPAPSTLAIRPEKVMLGQDYGISAIVTDVVFLGAFYRIFLSLPDGQKVTADTVEPPVKGAQTLVAWRPEDITLFERRQG